MSDFRSYWRKHWIEVGSDGGHRYSTDEWLHFYAKELMLYLPERPVRVLELGCGNGDLYGFLKQRFSSYVGAEFSPSMLVKFKLKWADANLVCADASRLPLGGSTYDFIFSYGLCQYLDEDMLRDNLAQVYRLLEPTGVYLIGNIPDSQLRLFYYARALRGDQDTSWLRLIRSLVNLLIGRTDGIGKWYSRRSICQLAAEHGFTCSTFSSSGYEYRFHAVLKKREAHDLTG